MEVIESKHNHCVDCGQKLPTSSRSSKLVVYTTKGVKLYKHIEKRCGNTTCRTGESSL